MNTKFVQPQPPKPPNSDKQVVQYLSLLVRYLNVEFLKRPPDTTLNSSVQLASPNGSVYTVTVTDAGILQTTLVKSS